MFRIAACYLFFSLVVRLEPHRFRSIVIVRHCHPEPEEEPPTVQITQRKQE